MSKTFAKIFSGKKTILQQLFCISSFKESLETSELPALPDAPAHGFNKTHNKGVKRLKSKNHIVCFSLTLTKSGTTELELPEWLTLGISEC